MTAKIKLNAASGGGSVSLKAPTSTTGNAAVELQLPVADGTANQVLKTDGSGNLSFGADTGGKILQVLQSTFTAATSTSSTSLVDTGLSVSITPSSTSNKILIMYALYMSVNENEYSGSTSLVRGSTEIFIGDAISSSRRATAFMWPNSGRDPHFLGHQFLDSPSTTSATTYKIQFRSNYTSQTVYIGRSTIGVASNSHSTTPASLIVMEVAG